MAPNDNSPRCLPDTREQIVRTVQAFMGKLGDAFRQRIVMLKRK